MRRIMALLSSLTGLLIMKMLSNKIRFHHTRWLACKNACLDESLEKFS